MSLTLDVIHPKGVKLGQPGDRETFLSAVAGHVLLHDGRVVSVRAVDGVRIPPELVGARFTIDFCFLLKAPNTATLFNM